MKVITNKFISWLMVQTRLVRYFVIAVLFHVLLVAVLGSMKIVAILPKIVAAFDAAPLPPLPEEEPDPFAVYRDFEYSGPTLGGGGGTGGKGPGGVPTAGAGMPEQYQAHILTPSAQAVPSTVGEVIGVFTESATAITRPVGGPSGIGLTAMGAFGDTKIGTAGIKGPGGGLLGARMGPQRSVALQKYKGSADTEKAVLAALRWLKVNQRDDGSWKCFESDEAGTALAVLAFLGHGETPDSPEFGKTVHAGLRYLVEQVNRDGYVVKKDASKGPNTYKWGYAQAFVTQALAEAYVMTGSPALREPLERAVSVILRVQQTRKRDPLHIGGWRYHPHDDDSDTSVAGNMTLALKAAHVGGITVPQSAFDQAEKFFWNMFAGPGFGYQKPDSWPGDTGLAVFCLQHLGRAKDRRITQALDFLRNQNVDWKKTEGSFVMYYWYYITQAMFHGGGAYWTYWNREIRDTLVKNQQDDGRWNAPPQSEAENRELGNSPVYTTALGALMLEVYYRFLPLHQAIEGASE